MWMAICYTFAGFLFLIFVLHNFFGFYKTAAHIPGPLSFPLIGCAHYLIGGQESALKKMMRIAEKYISPFRFPLGPRLLVFTTNPKHVKTILYSNKCAEKEKSIYKFLAVIGGNGLVTAENKLWRVHRKLVQPTFLPKIMASFVPIFQTNSLILTEAVGKYVNGSEVDLSHHIEQAFFSNICESTLDISLVTKRKEIEQYLTATRRIFQLMSQRTLQIWLHDDNIFSWSKIGKLTSECVTYIQNFTQKVIVDKRELLNSFADQEKENFEKRQKSTLDLLLELSYNESKLDVNDIRDHIITFIIAGYDTTSKTINFVLLMLALHPDIQDEVYKEIFNLYGDQDVEESPITYDDLKGLVYLEKVIKETMRLFPVVPVIARQTAEDFELDGHLIPKNCGVVIFIFGLHRNGSIWPNPLTFDPNRFSPELADKRHPCSFIPFSFAARDCLGRTYAMIVMKVFVATFLRKYIVKKDVITPVKDIRLRWDLLLDTVEPVTLRLERRRKQTNYTNNRTL